MAWDLRLDEQSRDLTSGYSVGIEEVLQRLVTRLNRELGEWFLETSAGLPWFQQGTGLLGSKNKFVLDMLVRKEVRGTLGVDRILKMNTTFVQRSYTIYLQLLLSDSTVVSFTMTEEGFSWTTV